MLTPYMEPRTEARTLAISDRDAHHPDTVPMLRNESVLLLFALFVFYQVYKLGTSGGCVQCGGKGAHRDDCPRGGR